MTVAYLIGGVACLAVAVGTALAPIRDRRRHDRAVPTTAVIVKVDVDEDEAGRSYHPVVRFHLRQGGREVTAKTWVPGHAGPTLANGRTVNIRYDPKDPTTVWVEGHTSLRSAFGVLWALVPAVALIARALK